MLYCCKQPCNEIHCGDNFRENFHLKTAAFLHTSLPPWKYHWYPVRVFVTCVTNGTETEKGKANPGFSGCFQYLLLPTHLGSCTVQGKSLHLNLTKALWRHSMCERILRRRPNVDDGPFPHIGSEMEATYLRGRQITLPHTDFSPLPNWRLAITNPSAAASLLPLSPHRATTWPVCASQRILPTGLAGAEPTEGFIQPLSIKIQSKAPLASNG